MTCQGHRLIPYHASCMHFFLQRDTLFTYSFFFFPPVHLRGRFLFEIYTFAWYTGISFVNPQDSQGKEFDTKSNIIIPEADKPMSSRRLNSFPFAVLFTVAKVQKYLQEMYKNLTWSHTCKVPTICTLKCFLVTFYHIKLK